MTVVEFNGPGLSEEQWRTVHAVATALKPQQALWLSGYFAGLADAGRPEAAHLVPAGLDPAPAAAARTLTILYGSETGNGKRLAARLAERAHAAGLAPVLTDMADYKPRRLKEEQDLLIVASTHGEGAPPTSAAGFFEFVEGRKAPRLEGLRYAVLALGDSTYEFFCGAGRRIDDRLAALGAERLHERVDCDVDYDDPAAAWIETALAALAPARTAAVPAAAASATPSAAAYDRQNPFPAIVIENLALTGRGSSKETRHVELSLEASGLVFAPGDALGVMPRNDPALVEGLLSALGLSGGEALTLKGEATTLGEALEGVLEITAATPRFLDQWAEVTGAAALKELAGDARSAFLRENHVIDILRRYPAKGIDAAALAAGLRPLQPRLYSIASSATAVPDEVHLTVSTVRYGLNGEERHGVASGQFSRRAGPETVLPVYVQENPRFRLPEGDAPIIMIGAGTGVAPYRAFLQEREAQGAKGRAWLFFGERNFDSDFLYQTEWQGFLKDGVLSRMNVAFSRDGAQKTYVQHRLLEEARELYAWLEEGAHLYVCGDGAKLAPDVHRALTAIVAEAGGRGKAAAEDYLAALRESRRYQIDVY
ncbi:assimilatory sulfite reductase (NADPH) flavoprotein subunit [Shinella zoogloeoides]|uniref:assimilatory sulfite reductase (NADPH) flavoprotein subunit n=1 Tax=Shinella zoogloeoides TaxID=352475 RepID=UPI000E6536A5|nr:assimilatory sulfite reductase (NADPH) flavoprotein subunit [Shinella zoogloeoides]